MAYEAKRWRDPPACRVIVCSYCKNRYPDKGCKAFPDGIPNELMDRNEHETPFPGDNGIRFELKEGYEEKYRKAREEQIKWDEYCKRNGI